MLMLTQNAFCEEQTCMSEYRDFIDSIPNDVKDKLPDTFINGTGNESDGIAEMSAPAYLLSELSDSFLAGVKAALPALCSVMGLIMISSVSHVISKALSGRSQEVMRVVSSVCVFASIASGCMSSLSMLRSYFNELCILASAYIPLSGALYAIGGNISTAVSASSSFGITLTVCEFLLSYTVFPVFCFCLCLCICSTFTHSRALISVSSSVKKSYTFMLSLLMAVLTVSITSQTFISAKADNFTMRGTKFAISSFIPLFGGSVASTLGHVASSVDIMRGTVGIGGIIILVLMLLPTVVQLAILRVLYSLTSSFAGMIGCDGEASLLSEISSLYGYLLSVATICSSVFFISFGLLCGCGCALDKAVMY